ncbi:unnamed protein product [Allacma fusca]|uniref:Uncharacterized protein n=1 Tax=Allacma fusca TaxID=39272 RepID=A0A8J2P786_9HEXA|nr:unnamed protein product [Allacma fusca]
MMDSNVESEMNASNVLPINDKMNECDESSVDFSCNSSDSGSSSSSIDSDATTLSASSSSSSCDSDATTESSSSSSSSSSASSSSSSSSDLGIDASPTPHCAKLNEDEPGQCPAPQVNVEVQQPIRMALARQFFSIESIPRDPVQNCMVWSFQNQGHFKRFRDILPVEDVRRQVEWDSTQFHLIQAERARARSERWRIAANIAPPPVAFPESCASPVVGKPFRPFAPLNRISAPLFGGAWHCATPMPSPSHEHCSDSFSVDLNPHVPKLTGNWSVGGPPSDSDFSGLDPIPYQHPRLSAGNWKTFNDIHGEDIAARQMSNPEYFESVPTPDNFNVVSPEEHAILESILAESPSDMCNLGFIHPTDSLHPSIFSRDSCESTESSSSSDDEDVAQTSEINSVVEPQVAGPSRPKPPPIKCNIWTQEQWAVIKESRILCEREELDRQEFAKRRCTRAKGEEPSTGLVFQKKTRNRDPQERAVGISGYSRKFQFVKKRKS